MSFKNAFKNLIAHFGVVWAILLYTVIFSALLVGLSLPFILPIANAFAEAGVFDGIRDSFSALLGDGGWNGLWDGLYAVYAEVVGVFENNDTVATLVMWFFIGILVVAFRFFFGLYEIPLATVLDGRMSCNAHYGLGGKFFSTLWVSVRYSLAKMPIMIAFDAVTYGIIYGIVSAIGLHFMLPFVIIAVIALMRAFRSGMLACWAPDVVNGNGVLKGFARSTEIFFKRFGSVYSTYLVTWLFMIAAGLFLVIFTLGVGLIVALPFIMCLLGNVGITVYYNKTGKRYYIDGVVFTPPVDNVI